MSARVVKTAMSSPVSSTRKRISAPSERPIQLRWIAIVRAGHSAPGYSSSSSAYAVVRMYHWVMFRSSTSAPQRSQWPSTTYSFAMTVWSLGHQLTGPSLR